MSGKGHPLPRSDEARHGEIPEHLEREKGCGDDAKGAVQPAGDAVAPDGAPYRSDVADESRAPHASALSGRQGEPGNRRDPGAAGEADEQNEDQAAHQDRGQSIAEQQAGRS